MVDWKSRFANSGFKKTVRVAKTVVIQACDIPPEAARAGGKTLEAWLKLYALANGIQGKFKTNHYFDGSVMLSEDL